MKSYKKLSSRVVLENPWYKVRIDKVIRPDGTNGEFHVVEAGQSCFVVPITDDNKITLVYLERYQTGRSGWEVPAGGREGDESLLSAAQRELQEETGFISDSWKEVSDFDCMNGISDSHATVFIARNCRQSGQNDQVDEGITSTKAFAISDILNMILNGEIVDGLSIAALMMALTAEKLIKE